jgi:hypothetical protein
LTVIRRPGLGPGRLILGDEDAVGESKSQLRNPSGLGLATDGDPYIGLMGIVDV